VSIWSARAADTPADLRDFPVSGVVPRLLNASSMRRRLPMVLAIVVVVGIGLRYLSQSIGLEDRLVSLASQPGVRTAFQHPESARSDALTALIAVSLVTPIAAFVVTMLAVLVVKMFEALLVSIHLPAWLSLPVISMSALAAIYATSPSWVPQSLYALGLVARAYLVYSDSAPPVFQ
jgi:hypothetical protein